MLEVLPAQRRQKAKAEDVMYIRRAAKVVLAAVLCDRALAKRVHTGFVWGQFTKRFLVVEHYVL